MVVLQHDTIFLNYGKSFEGEQGEGAGRMGNDQHTFGQQDEQRNAMENSGYISISGNTDIILQMNMIHLTEEDLSLISAFRPVIVSRIEQITSSFYESILHVGKLKEIITKHTTVERLRLTLSNHLIEMFSGKIDEAFIQKRLKIALVHQKIGLPPKWYLGAFQNLQNTLLRIAHEMRNELPHYDRFIQAITKLLSFEQQLVLEAYEEKTREVEQKAKEFVEYQAHHDELTGLPNRRMFQKVLREAIARNEKNRTKFAVLMLDIDRFKLINDSLGHTYGDQFLQEVSKRILACAEGYQALVARMGGDEFTLICEECPNRGGCDSSGRKSGCGHRSPLSLEAKRFLCLGECWNRRVSRSWYQRRRAAPKSRSGDV